MYLRTVFIFLFLAHLAFSEQMNGNFGLVALGGFSSSNHKGVGLGQVDSKMGLTFGIGFDFKVLPNVAIEVDILNTQKNFELTATGTRESYTLTYLEAPVLVKWIASKNFHLKTGPYLTGLLIDGNRESAGQANPVKASFKNDYGVTFGTWFGFQTKKNLQIGLDLRYDLGLADIQWDNDPSTLLYTRTFMALMTLTFNFK